MLNQSPAIIVDNVKKGFKIPLDGTSGIKQSILNFYKRKKGYRTFRALDGVSFEVSKGEFFGIVGRNGSGKSTLLKMLAGVYTPDEGAVAVNGSLTPFIELGVGFNPELTGRENVFLNGALLGFSRKEMEAMYEDIVDFAELHDFMEERLKNYSSGMQVRLAFSIAIRADTDVLLLDEVLAVGDEAFQRKCFGYFEQLRKKKKTVILVTHDMGAVERFCTRAAFIQDGKCLLVGTPHEVAAAYSRSNDSAFNEATESDEDEPVENTSRMSIEITNDNNEKVHTFTAGDSMTVTLRWEDTGVNYAGVAILKQSGEYVFGTSTYQDKTHVIPSNSRTVSYKVKLDISEGEYFVKAGLYGRSDMDRIDFNDDGPTFVVNRDKDDFRWGGLAKLSFSWFEQD